MSERPIDSFEINFRLLGNEVFGMQINSQSTVKNWAAFGLIALITVTILTAQIVPLVYPIITPV